MLAWTRELDCLRRELEDEAETPTRPSRDVPPKSWEVCLAPCPLGGASLADASCPQSWIFLESLHRSIMASYLYMCVFCLMRSEDRRPPRNLPYGHGKLN